MCAGLGPTRGWLSRPTARTALAEEPGFPVVERFRGLNVEQQESRRRRVGPLEERVSAVSLWFRRCARLTLPWAAGLRIAADAGVSSAVYGAGGAVWRAATVREGKEGMVEGICSGEQVIYRHES